MTKAANLVVKLVIGFFLLWIVLSIAASIGLFVSYLVSIERITQEQLPDVQAALDAACGNNHVTADREGFRVREGMPNAWFGEEQEDSVGAVCEQEDIVADAGWICSCYNLEPTHAP